MEHPQLPYNDDDKVSYASLCTHTHSPVWQWKIYKFMYTQFVRNIILCYLPRRRRFEQMQEVNNLAFILSNTLLSRF